MKSNTDTLFLLLRKLTEENNTNTVQRKEFEKKASNMGIKKEAINKFLDDYSSLSVLFLNDKNEIVLIQINI